MTDVDAILHFTELRIVLMMCVIGLEMRVDAPWAMLQTIFGYGAMLMVVCAVVLSAIDLARIAARDGFRRRHQVRTESRSQVTCV